MWPRYFEFFFGFWLLLTPAIFDHGDQWPQLALNERICGALVILLTLVSFQRRFRWSHFVTFAVALWIWGFAWTVPPRPGPPAAQSDITVAILLLMFVILPNEASRPPVSWRKFNEEQKQSR